MAMPDLPERPQDQRRRKEYGTSRVRKWEKALAHAIEQRFSPKDDLDEKTWQQVASGLLTKKTGTTQKDLGYRAYMRAIKAGSTSAHLTKLKGPEGEGAKQARQDLIDTYGKEGDVEKKTEAWQEGFSLALDAASEGYDLREVSVLRDPSQRVLGTIRKRSDDTLEIRNSSNKFRGSYDPTVDETRDATGRLIGTGNLLAALLVNEAKGNPSAPPGLAKGPYWDYVGKTPFGSKPKSDKIPDQGKKSGGTIKQDPIKSLEARDYEKEYRSYHGTPKQRKNRSTRNQARRKMELETGDEREVDHSKPLSQGGTNHKNNLKVVSFAKNRSKGAAYESDISSHQKSVIDQRQKLLAQQADIEGQMADTDDPKEWDKLSRQLKQSNAKLNALYRKYAGYGAKHEGVDPIDPIMEPGFVKTPADEKKWDRAKTLAKKSNPDNLYAVANHIFQNIKTS